MCRVSASRSSMVVVLNGVLADDCPTSVRALLAAHPGYRDAAAQLLAAAPRVVCAPGLLYVGQRELAAVVPHDSKSIPNVDYLLLQERFCSRPAAFRIELAVVVPR